MFIDEQMAFASVFKNLLVVLLLYIFVAASVFAFRRRSKAQLLKIQMMQEEAYKQKLTGIIILDVNGKVKCEYSTDDLNSRALQDKI